VAEVVVANPVEDHEHAVASDWRVGAQRDAPFARNTAWCARDEAQGTFPPQGWRSHVINDGTAAAQVNRTQDKGQMVLERCTPVTVARRHRFFVKGCSHTKNVRLILRSEATEDARRVDRVRSRTAQQLEERIMSQQRHKRLTGICHTGPKPYDTHRATFKNPLRKATVKETATAALGHQVRRVGNPGRAQGHGVPLGGALHLLRRLRRADRRHQLANHAPVDGSASTLSLSATARLCSLQAFLLTRLQASDDLLVCRRIPGRSRASFGGAARRVALLAMGGISGTTPGIRHAAA